MRFIRMMKRNTGTREKMWAGQTAPFFCPQKSNSLFLKCKKARKGPFGGLRRYQRSRSLILPFTPSHSSASGRDSFFSVMFGQTSANSTFN
ncbi:hypothetical protein FQ186_06495 [Pseudomonas sp. ANT_H14]|nr:hypothetical protein FQ182_13370 [Pseudomonas sp. ANT_H4]KAA0953190.1 hypothetical protein FQ186_06495 [Pseudomonas sp. ANT_H14]